MGFVSRLARYHLLLCIFFVCLPGAQKSLAAEECAQVLHVNSYSTVLDWAVELGRSMRATVHQKKPYTKITTEYLDTKKYHSAEYYTMLANIFEKKYKQEKFDAIVVSDDNAANFVFSIREWVFPDTPIVFCGVNNLQLGQSVSLSNTTGIFEKTDVAKTLAIALEQNPAAKKVFVINDHSSTGEANHMQLLAAMHEFEEKVEFELLRDFSMKELLKKVGEIPSKSVVLLFSFTTDAKGNRFTYQQSISMIRSVCAVPMYGLWDFYVGTGIVGGMITSGSVQGKKAGEMVVRILDGEAADSIPMVRKSPNQYMFDHYELRRFGIPDGELPEGSIVVDCPQSVWKTHFWWAAVISGIVLLLVLLIMILGSAIVARRAAEKKLALINHSLEEVVEEKTEELRQRSMDLEGANARLQELDTLKTSLMNTVSHDLRTPLTSIIGFAVLIRKGLEKLCKDQCTDKESKKSMNRIFDNVGVIIKEGHRLARLINDFLDMSRLDAGRMPWDDKKLDPARLGQDAIEAQFGSFSRKENVQLIGKIEKGLPPVMADYDRLRQVLANLLSNAYQFTSAGSVTLRISQKESFILFSVLDTGPGVPDEELDKIFETFHQVSTDTLPNKPAGKGSGMGLAICQSIVHHYEGQIWAEHNPGGGAIISFTIPVFTTLLEDDTNTSSIGDD